MMNKIVCPKCGQLYDAEAERCPLCGQPTQQRPAPEAAPAPQRRRVTEVERQQHRRIQQQDARDEKRRRKLAKMLADAEEERQLQAAEEQERLDKKRRKLEKRGLPDDEIRRRLAMERREIPDVAVLPDPRRVPAGFLIPAILILLLAIVVGGSFLLWRAGVVKIGMYEYLSGTSEDGVPASERCDAVSLTDTELEFTSAGVSYKLRYTLSPAECALPVQFQSSDDSIVEVDDFGVLRAVGPGSATITVKCGTAQAQCAVTCSFVPDAPPDPETLDLPDGLELSAVDITFFNPKENTYLHVTNVPNGTEIVWTSTDEAVATVDSNGYVVAVGRGLCYVTATVGPYAESCTVRCNFVETETQADSEG